MIIIENKVNNKFSFIIDKDIYIGGKKLTLVKFEKYCEKNNISNEIKQEVLNAYNENIKTKENWAELAKVNIFKIKLQVAKYNNRESLEVLVKDKLISIKEQVAKHNHKDLLDILVEEEDYTIRYQVAKHGYREHLLKLKNDWECSTRSMVASFYNEDILNELKNDTTYYVANIALETLKKHSK